MTTHTEPPGGRRLDDDLRDALLADPDALLGDAEVMRALVGAHERSLGSNIVDLRGAAMKRLEGRLDRLEETHRTVIAAAYENLAGTNLVHRAVLRLLEPDTFPDFLTVLTGPLPDILRLDSLRLVLESHSAAPRPGLEAFASVLHSVEPGFLAGYLGETGTYRAPVTLRACPHGAGVVHGRPEGHIRSEAVIALDLGSGRLPGILVLGSAETEQFAPRQATDLLRFFGNVFSVTLRRWLA